MGEARLPEMDVRIDRPGQHQPVPEIEVLASSQDLLHGDDEAVLDAHAGPLQPSLEEQPALYHIHVITGYVSGLFDRMAIPLGTPRP